MNATDSPVSSALRVLDLRITTATTGTPRALPGHEPDGGRRPATAWRPAWISVAAPRPLVVVLP